MAHEVTFACILIYRLPHRQVTRVFPTSGSQSVLFNFRKSAFRGCFAPFSRYFSFKRRSQQDESSFGGGPGLVGASASMMSIDEYDDSERCSVSDFSLVPSGQDIEGKS